MPSDNPEIAHRNMRQLLSAGFARLFRHRNTEGLGEGYGECLSVCLTRTHAAALLWSRSVAHGQEAPEVTEDGRRTLQDHSDPTAGFLGNRFAPKAASET